MNVYMVGKGGYSTFMQDKEIGIRRGLAEMQTTVPLLLNSIDSPDKREIYNQIADIDVDAIAKDMINVD